MKLPIVPQKKVDIEWEDILVIVSCNDAPFVLMVRYYCGWITISYQ